MSIYRSKQAVGTTFEALTNTADDQSIFRIFDGPEYGQARIYLQNEGAEGVTFRLRRRPHTGDKPTQPTPQWQSYGDEVVGADDEPQTILIELTEGYEYIVEAKTSSGTTDVSAWVHTVVGEAT